MDHLSSDNVSEIAGWDQENYWWYVVRNMWLDEAVREARTRHPSLKLVDVGCGPGGVLQSMCRRHKFDFVLGLDGDERLLKLAREKNLPVQRHDCYKDFELPERPNLWFCLDMLEHVEYDAGVVKNIRKASEPGTFLTITVPAHPILYSPWDRDSGHYRRYTRARLRRILTPNGWRIRRMFHFFSFLAPIAFVSRVIAKGEPKVPQVSPAMNRALIAVGSLERYLPIRPMGTSLFCLAEAV